MRFTVVFRCLLHTTYWKGQAICCMKTSLVLCKSHTFDLEGVPRFTEIFK